MRGTLFFEYIILRFLKEGNEKVPFFGGNDV